MDFQKDPFQAQPATNWVASSTPGAPSSAQDVGQGGGSFAVLPKPPWASRTSIISLLGEEECSAAWRAQNRCVSICPTRSSFPPVFPQRSPRPKSPAMNKTLFQISIPFSTPYETKGMSLFCRGVGRRCTCCLLVFLYFGSARGKELCPSPQTPLDVNKRNVLDLALGFNKT